MAEIIRLNLPKESMNQIISLSGSKSISNRALIIKALSKGDFELTNLSTSQDTVTLEKLLKSKDKIRDAGHAGTTFRFLTAYLSFHGNDIILTGSERMKERPIGPLVDALRQLGAEISYEEKEKYPPLKIKSINQTKSNSLSIPANMSSQYISALALIAPYLENGLQINLKEKLVSPSYLEMTLKLMKHFGVDTSWEGQTIDIEAQKYISKDLFVEGDWSSASYLYGIVALVPNSEIKVKNLSFNSVQGDRAVAEIFNDLGVDTQFLSNEIIIKNKNTSIDHFEYHLINQPDIAQTISIVCAAKGLSCKLTGLQTLAIKETDRIAALKNELAKVGVEIEVDEGKTMLIQNGKAISNHVPLFETYDDHRMAMALSLLGTQFPIQIKDYLVVKKSYPDFWKDIESLGFKIEKKV